MSKFLFIVILFPLFLFVASCNRNSQSEQPSATDLSDDIKGEITFTQYIAPIIHKNCVPCHNPDGAGPFSLITYQDIAKRAKMIKEVTRTKYMPLWKADINYRSFIGERFLSETEIKLIGKWADTGRKYGDTNIVVKPPETKSFSNFSRKPDKVFSLDKPFIVPDTGEYFVLYMFDTGLNEDAEISAFEFVPGNMKIVHHAWLLFDTSGYYDNLFSNQDGPGIKHIVEHNQFTLMDEKRVQDGGLIYTPGFQASEYPKGITKRLPAKAKLMLSIHYVSTGKPEKDSSYLNVYYAKQPVQRHVEFIVFDETLITNQPFEIPPNTIKTFNSRSPKMPMEISILTISPHMHYRGKNMTIFAVTPKNDTIHLLRINDWDLNLQGIYRFKNPLKLPFESEILMNATFDNTMENPSNPVVPPVKAVFGMRSKDEMCQYVIEFVRYMEGDEKMQLNIKNE